MTASITARLHRLRPLEPLALGYGCHDCPATATSPIRLSEIACEPTREAGDGEAQSASSRFR